MGATVSARRYIRTATTPRTRVLETPRYASIIRQFRERTEASPRQNLHLQCQISNCDVTGARESWYGNRYVKKATRQTI